MRPRDARGSIRAGSLIYDSDKNPLVYDHTTSVDGESLLVISTVLPFDHFICHNTLQLSVCWRHFVTQQNIGGYLVYDCTNRPCRVTVLFCVCVCVCVCECVMRIRLINLWHRFFSFSSKPMNISELLKHPPLPLIRNVPNTKDDDVAAPDR